MKKLNLFYIMWVAVAAILFFVSMHYKKQSDAIVAEVQPQKTAISFQKPVKIKAIHVIPGQDVKKSELLVEVERPDLLFDIEKATNQMHSVIKEKDMYISNVSYQIQLINLERFNDIQQIDEEILRLESKYNQNKQIVKSLESIDSEQDSISGDFISIIALRLTALKNEKIQIESIYKEKTKQLADKRETEIELYELKINQLESEIDLLKGEENFLKNYSPVNGTIGEVYTQTGELIKPYSTVLSIYNKNPTIITAFMNESNRYNLKVNDQVMVESGNREYAIEGKVKEIGSRIVTYPMRLLPFQDRKIWGQEIFVEIPESNDFLNGEKVFVRIIE